jgi:hypothetical protein
MQRFEFKEKENRKMALPDPTIRIRVTGLFVLFPERDPNDPSRVIACNIGVCNNEQDRNHQRRVFVHEVSPVGDGIKGSNAILEIMKKMETANISLTVENPVPNATGIIIYPSAVFPRDPADSGFPFSHIPNIEGSDLHNGHLTHSFRQFISLNNGVFYTKKKNNGWIVREKGGLCRFRDIGTDVGINIYLRETADSRAVLTYGTPQRQLELKRKPNTIYEIEILNDCPVPKSSSDDLFESDFKKYYDFFQVAADERFGIVFPIIRGSGPLDRDHPCGSISGGMPTS